MQWRRERANVCRLRKDEMSKTQKIKKRATNERRRQIPTASKAVLTSEPSGARRGSRAATGQQTTKAAQILALVKRPAGATLKAIRVATGWQAHSVRGFISGHLVKKMRLRVKSFRRGGERVYSIKN